MKRNMGFTLVELLVVMGIIGIVTSIAVPSFNMMLQRNHLTTVVEALQADMQLVRTKAIKQSANMRLSRNRISGTAGDWCYGVNLTSAGTCNCVQTDDIQADYCDLKRVLGSEYNTVILHAEGITTGFDFRRGTANGSGATFATTNYVARVSVSSGGRVLICTPATADRPSDTIGLPNKPNC